MYEFGFSVNYKYKLPFQLNLADHVRLLRKNAFQFNTVFIQTGENNRVF